MRSKDRRDLAFWRARRKDLIQTAMQPVAEACGNLEDAVIGNQYNNIVSRIHHCGADLAMLQMAVDFGAQDCVHISVDIRRDVLPDVLAIDLHTRLPNHERLAAGANPFKIGTNSFCNSVLARCNLTFTEPGVIPSTSEVSWTSSSSISLSWTTSR